MWYKTSPKIVHRGWFSPEEYRKLYEATRRRAQNPKKQRFSVALDAEVASTLFGRALQQFRSFAEELDREIDLAGDFRASVCRSSRITAPRP